MYFYQRDPPKPPPKLVLQDLSATGTSDVTFDKINQFLEEKAKPRKPKQRWGGWSSSSYNDEPEGKETIESIGKLLPTLLMEMVSKDGIIVETTDACKAVATEIANMKKHLPFKRVTTRELEKVTTAAIDVFFESKFTKDFESESFEFSRFIEAFKYSENIEKWLLTLFKRKEIDCRDVVVDSFKKNIFNKPHVVKKIFEFIESESDMEMTDTCRDLLRTICFGINLDYTELDDETLKQLGKRFVNQ